MIKSHPSRSIGGSSKELQEEDTGYIQFLPFYKALDNGDWEVAMNFLEKHPAALTASLSADGDTALHIAVLAGHDYIVEELVNLLDAKDLALMNKNSATALNYAALGGITSIAMSLVSKNRELLRVPNQNGQIPVVVASLYGHKDMARNLYAEGPLEDLDPEKGKNGAMLLTTCIIDELYDIALDLLGHYPQLAFEQDGDNDTSLQMLAQKPSAFLSGANLGLWSRCIYSLIRVPQPQPGRNIHGDVEDPNGSPNGRRSPTARAIDQLLIFVWKTLKPFVPTIRHLYNLKLTHGQANELLICICQQMSTLHKSQFQKMGVYKALFTAVKHGIVELITQMIKHYPEIIWCEDEHQRGIFLYATHQRQEKIFSLIYRLGAKKNAIATTWDKYHNNILHQAAVMSPTSQLDRVSGAALQMQRELQWYKEVESLVQPKYREMVNKQLKTPSSLFTETHKRLVKEGEEWIKETAQSSTVVAALIATIMFAALFTIPGGYDQNTGYPYLINNSLFMVFIVSDALSLFSSTSSLLMFLGILTSRYREEDFLKSLPTKLITGLSTLFFSIATMMATFGVALVITLKQQISWVSLPMILLASLPVSLFAVLQFPLLLEIFLATFGPGIFDKPKTWCFSSLRPSWLRVVKRSCFKKRK